MQIKEIHFAPHFKRQFRKLPHVIKWVMDEKVKIFLLNPFDARLKTHKLHGKDANDWAFSVNQAYRIKFRFLTDDEVVFAEIGTHDIYQ
jgi:mRNA-degrading endonuclease YafQ of YafQ-DinJ toxin-antitoxin module